MLRFIFGVALCLGAVDVGITLCFGHQTNSSFTIYYES